MMQFRIQIGKLLLGGLIYLLFQCYVIQDERLISQLGQFKYCQNNKNKELCEKNKFDKFFILYLDGVGKFFLDYFIEKHPKKHNFAISKIIPKGIADSEPTFYTYFTGQLPLFFIVSMYNEDNFFKQLKFANLNSRNCMIDYMGELINKNYDDQQYCKEHRGLYWSVDNNLLDWFYEFYENDLFKNIRVVDELLNDQEAVQQYFYEQMENFDRIMEKRQKKLFQSLKRFFDNNPRNFIYIPQTDNFCHYSTLYNKRFVAAIAMVISNINFIQKYLDQFSSDTLFVAMSDHGGDESPYQQERSNHDTPNNKKGNDAFLMFYNKNIKNQNYAGDISSTEVSGIISHFLKNVNSIGGFDFNQKFFKSEQEKLKYLQFIEKRFQSFQSHYFVEESPDLVYSNTQEYEQKLEAKAKNLQKRLKNASFFYINLFVYVYMIILFIIFCKPFFSQLQINRVQIKIIFLLPFFYLCYSIYIQEIKELDIEVFVYIFIIYALLISENNQQRLTYLIILISILILIIFNNIGLKYEQFFYNNKNIYALLLSYTLLAVYLVNYFKQTSQNITKEEQKIKYLIIIFLICIVLFDYFYLFITSQKSDVMMNAIIYIAYGIMILIVVGLLQTRERFLNQSLMIFYLELVFWTLTIQERLVFMLILYPLMFFIRSKFKHFKKNYKSILYLTIILLNFVIYFRLFYHFDWRNKIRLLWKFNISFIYKTIFLGYSLICCFYISSNQKKQQISKRIYLTIEYILGFLFIFSSYHLQNEYKIIDRKLMDHIIMGYGYFIILSLLYNKNEYKKISNKNVELQNNNKQYFIGYQIQIFQLNERH